MEWTFLKKLKIDLLHDSAFLFLGIKTKGKRHLHTSAYFCSIHNAQGRESARYLILDVRIKRRC